MTAQNKATIKGYFETDDIPTESNFADLVDSYADVVHTHGEADITDLQHAIPIYEDGVFAVTGTAIDFEGDLDVSVTGSFVYVDVTAGSGNSTSTGSYAARPAAGTSGDLYFPTDGFTVQRDNGVAWQPWGPLFPFVEPVDGNFSWVNQDSATVSATKGGIFLATDADAGKDLRMRVHNVTAPYVITACILPVPHVVTGGGTLGDFGLCFYQTGTTEVHTFGMYMTSAEVKCLGNKWTNPDNVNSSYFTQEEFTSVFPIWIRIEDNSTNRICSLSSDGQNWATVHTIGNTDFLTADQAGFYCRTDSVASGILVLSYEET